MKSASPEAAVRFLTDHQRALVWIGFYGLVLACWAALYTMTISPLPGISAADYWASLCVAAGEADPFALFGMWALMTGAMMLPSFAPALRVFADIGGIGASDATSRAALVMGYAVAWLMFSALAVAAQVGLSRLTFGWSAMAVIDQWLGVALLIFAGAYQFSRFKAACLAKCRHPLLFFMQHWRPGLAAALGMGARLGAYCVGCCWVLMALGFVGGAMNLLWMGAATLFMTLEKLPGLGGYLTRPAGIALLVAGGLAAAQNLHMI